MKVTRFKPHWNRLGLGGAKCDECGLPVGPGQDIWVEPIGTHDAKFTCKRCKEKP